MTREEYVLDIVEEDEILQSVRRKIEERGIPAISVAPELGKLLTILVKTCGARRVLEIGALGGYSGICLARGLPDEGKLVSLELNEEYAAFAKSNLAAAGLGHKVEYRVGPAADSLAALAAEGQRFDFFFIDADKPNYPVYLQAAIGLANPGALIVADNVLLQDRVLDPDNHSPSPTAMRQFNAMLKADNRLEATLLPVRDGFAIARVRSQCD
jgi:predicted O-methyltransferase YrrM